ncbi:unnamed protein product [Anisakis simplex]|uniref:Caprin-1_dimer domain-containing protein n=1 Tax=Anisakis simplex TaxID=6269 RepID=A0A0M3JZR2_ANISI|nr:unnamed protein product [Anisakis simplex]
MKGPVDNATVVAAAAADHAASNEDETKMVTNPYSRIEDAMEKKRRNLEKRKIRLQQYEEDERNGKKLSEEQQEARSRIGEVETQLEFIKDIVKMLATIQREFTRSLKQRDEAFRRKFVESEREHLAEFIYYQNIFRIFSKPHVTKALIDAENGAEPKLTMDEWMDLQDISTAFNPHLPPVDTTPEWMPMMRRSAIMANCILSGSKERVIGKANGMKARQLMEKAAGMDCVKDLKFVLNLVTDSDDDLLSEADEDDHEDSVGGMERIGEGECVHDRDVAQERSEEEAKRQQEEADTPPIVTNAEESSESTFIYKSDPKVIFVHGESERPKNGCGDLLCETTNTEFGFENYVVHAQVINEPVIRDPPPPIPLPNAAVQNSSTDNKHNTSKNKQLSSKQQTSTATTNKQQQIINADVTDNNSDNNNDDNTNDNNTNNKTVVTPSSTTPTMLNDAALLAALQSVDKVTASSKNTNNCNGDEQQRSTSIRGQGALHRNMRMDRRGRGGRGMASGIRSRNTQQNYRFDATNNQSNYQAQPQSVRASGATRAYREGAGRYMGRIGRGGSMMVNNSYGGFRGGNRGMNNGRYGQANGYTAGGYNNSNAYDYASSHPHRQAGFNFANDYK